MVEIQNPEDLKNGNDSSTSAALDRITFVDLAARRGALDGRHASTTVVDLHNPVQNVWSDSAILPEYPPATACNSRSAW
jgi:hypothetical protein